MNVWIIGPGPSLLKYKSLIEKLNDKTTIVLGKAFPHCIEYFNLHPTYWTWHDPHESVYGIEFLNKNDYNIKAILPSPLCRSKDDFKRSSIDKSGIDFSNKYITWSMYENFLKSKKLDIKWIESKVMKTLVANDIDLAVKVSEDLNFRFNSINDMIIGTHYKNVVENTISRLLLPMCQKMKFKKVFILGFDGQPGRFYSSKYPADKNGERLYKQKTSPYVGQFTNLNKWVEWSSHTSMDVYSVLPGPINKHITNISFNDALELDK
jgi:hypothetical protein